MSSIKKLLLPTSDAIARSIFSANKSWIPDHPEFTGTSSCEIKVKINGRFHKTYNLTIIFVVESLIAAVSVPPV